MCLVVLPCRHCRSIRYEGWGIELCHKEFFFLEGGVPFVSLEKSSRLGRLMPESFTWALVGGVWACLPFSRAFLFQLAFSLGCVPFFGQIKYRAS